MNQSVGKRYAATIIFGLFLAGMLWASVLYCTPADAAPAARVSVSASCHKDGSVTIRAYTTKPTTVTIAGIGDKSVTARVKGSLYLTTDSDLFVVGYSGQKVFPRDPFRNPCIVRGGISNGPR